MYRDDLVFKDECYLIVGILFKVYKELGGNLLEKHYQKAVAAAFKKAGIDFVEQYPIKIYFNGKYICTFYADFLVKINAAEIILEVKKRNNFGEKNIRQVNDYLKNTGFKLGILGNFTLKGVIYKRIVNVQN